MAALKNASKQLYVLNMEHSYVCNDQKCFCSETERVTIDHNPKTGDRGARVQTVKLPASLYLPPGETVRQLPDSVLRLPAVVKGLAARELFSV